MATGALVATAIVSAASAVYSGSMQAAAASDQAKQAKLQGESSMIQSRMTAAQMAKDAAALKGKQVAQAAANGMDVGSKSLIDIQNTTDKQAQDDINFTLSNGRMALATAQATASSYSNQASGFMTSGFMNAGSSLMGGMMNVGKVQGWKGFDKL
jgi:hypothetical protein